MIKIILLAILVLCLLGFAFGLKEDGEGDYSSVPKSVFDLFRRKK